MDINLFTILKHVINVAVIYFVLRLLLYKPVVKFMNGRADRIAKKIADAEEMSAKAQAGMEEYQHLMDGSKREIEKLHGEAEEKAAREAERIVREAESHAGELLKEAREQAQAEKDRVFAKMQDEVVDMAISIAAKVLQREITEEDNRAIIDKFFTKAG